MKKLTILLSFLLSLTAFAQAEKKDTPVKDHLQNHFKLYGFIRNYFIYDSRESKSGTSDLFYYLPLDKKMNEDGSLDLNQHSSFRFVALTSRAGLDVTGYQIGNVHFGAKFEADFYAGLSSVNKDSYPNVSKFFPGNTSISGTAQMRLRQAYATVTWKELPLCGEQKASVGLKVGQAWHPMAADMPQVFDLEVGAPFGPFSRTPQVTMDASLGKNWIISASAIWQMQYQSAGPVGSSAIYMKYGMTPEIYAGVTFKSKGFLARAGVDVVSIKPRVYGTKSVSDPTDSNPSATRSVTVKVSDRKTSLLYYLYAQYSYKTFQVKAKTTYGEGGEHMNLMSGYAKVGENSDGSWNYASLRNSSSWLSMSVGKKWQGVLFVGYMKNLGLAKPAKAERLLASTTKTSNTLDVYFCGNGFSNLNQMYRINPQLIYNIGKLNLGIEYQWTSVQYGDYSVEKVKDGENTITNKYLNASGLATDNLHWVGNHRVSLMLKYNF